MLALVSNWIKRFGKLFECFHEDLSKPELVLLTEKDELR